MAKWHGYGRCKTRLSNDIGKVNSSNIQNMMTYHTISVAKSLEEKKFINITLAVTGLGLKRSRKWANELGIENFSLQGRGCLGEKMKRQTILSKKFFLQKKIKNIIFLGTDLPDLCHLDILSTIKELKKNDLILGPSNDGGYWLIAFSEKLLSKHLYLPFINIRWSSENVLRDTIENFSKKNINYKLLNKKIDIDTISDIEKRH